MKNYTAKETGEIIGILIFLIFLPIIIFGAGWIGGWLLKVIVGNAVANGLNALFGTTRFTPDALPIVCGALATIGSYFKSTNSKKD